jgi:sterol desaturase/sphingolipid hydroxylase (fatty acid hydroxylase superfamily)
VAGSDLSWIVDGVKDAAVERGQLVMQLLFSPGSPYSLAAMLICTIIAAAATLANRGPKREVRLKVLLRAMFPRRIVMSESGRADLFFSFFNIFLWFLMFGWAVVSAQEVAKLGHGSLTSLFGSLAPSTLPRWTASALMTFMLFVAFELGYWMNHYLSHKIPVLWAFHKVHHCAESLSPLTDFRVHPIYTVIFYNIVAVTMGLMEGMGRYLLGDDVAEFSIGGMNILLLATGILLVHLQHSHFWISFSGRLGLFISSPAHHQIHHSADPAHYDRNFGGSLAIWDHLFGTLHLPLKKREKLRFGMPALDYNPHSLRAGFLIPFREALEALRPRREPRQVESSSAAGTEQDCWSRQSTSFQG